MDYDVLQVRINTKITKYGTSATITTFTKGAFNATADTYSAATSTAFAVKILITSYKAKDIDGTLIKRGDKELLLPAYGLPRIDQMAGDAYFHINQGGRVLDVQTVIAIDPGGTALLYKIQVRGY